MKEEWKTIKYFPDYEINRSGTIKRKITSQNNSRWRAGYIKKISDNGYGYQITQLFNKNASQTVFVHRLLLEVFVGPCPKDHECNHKDGNKSNNALSNLEWVTHSENEKHAHRLGLKKSIGCPGRVGEKHPMCRLKTNEVLLINKLLRHKIPQSKIAKIFKIAQTTVSKINLGVRWPHLQGQSL